jgi:low affinity Fe/Cu permease
MTDTQAVATVASNEQSDTEPEPLFQRIADRVSYGMGTPLNIGIWVVLVVGWTLLFALNVVNANGTFLPKWFTSTGFNFPLNLVTTVAELYIGFLVGASSNRSERNLETTLARISAQDEQIDEVELRLSESLKQNTELTTEIHKLTKVIHQIVCASHENMALEQGDTDGSGEPAG